MSDALIEGNEERKLLISSPSDLLKDLISKLKTCNPETDCKGFLIDSSTGESSSISYDDMNLLQNFIFKASNQVHRKQVDAELEQNALLGQNVILKKDESVALVGIDEGEWWIWVDDDDDDNAYNSQANVPNKSISELSLSSGLTEDYEFITHKEVDESVYDFMKGILSKSKIIPKDLDPDQMKKCLGSLVKPPSRGYFSSIFAWSKTFYTLGYYGYSGVKLYKSPARVVATIAYEAATFWVFLF